MVSKQEAATARATAAKVTDARERLSALEVERRGYVQRGDDKGVAAVDDEIAHWSNVADIPLVSGVVNPDETHGDGQEADKEANTAPDDQEPADAENAPQTGTSESEQPTGRRSRAKAAAGAEPPES